MKLGVVTSNGNFLKPVLDEFARRGHDVLVYQHTADAGQNMYQLGQIRASCERVFCDWAQEPTDYCLKELEVPVFVRAHRIEAYNDAWVKAQPWHKAAGMFFIADHIRERFARHWQQPPAQVITLPHVGIDASLWHMPEDPRRWAPPWNVALIGFVVPKKRVYTSLQMLADLGPDWNVEIVGNGQDPEYPAFCTELIARLKMNARVRSSEWVEQAALLGPYHRAHVVMCNSTTEGCSTVTAEGMACGCVPFINAWTGAENVYPPEYIFETPKGFYELAERWAAMPPEEKQARSEAAREWVLPRFDGAAIAAQIADVVTGPVDAQSVGAWYSTAFLEHMTEQDGNSRQRACFEAVCDALAEREAQGWQHQRYWRSFLDIGCGTGWVAREVAAQGLAESFGMDVAAGLIEFAAEKAAEAKLEGLQFAVADAAQALITGPHDVISAFDVLEHMQPEQHAPLITRIASELKPGGVFIARVPHRAGRDNQIVEHKVYPKVLKRRCEQAGLTVETFDERAGGYFEVVARKGAS